jgi:hypothetical protein
MMKNAAESIHTNAVNKTTAPHSGKTLRGSLGSQSTAEGTAANPASAKAAPIHACPAGDWEKTEGKLHKA